MKNIRERSENKKEFDKEIFSFQDKIIMCNYHFLYKFLPEFSVQITDFISKLIGKSCKSLAIVILILIHKIPFFGRIIDDLINNSKGSKVTSISIKDIVFAILNCVTIILFSWKGYEWKKISFEYSMLGFFLVISGLLIDALKSLKITILNDKYNALNNKELSEKLKVEYMVVFNFGLLIYTLIGIIYQILFQDLGQVIYYNFLTNLNFKFIIVYALLIVSNSFQNYFHFTIIRNEGPIKLAFITSIRKVLSLFLNLIIYQKSIDSFKGIALSIVTAIIIYELVHKLKKEKKKQVETIV